MSVNGPPRLPSLPYLPHVDGLRALAIALVVIYHAWPSAVPGGFVGVDVFFVISGFIITRQLAFEIAEASFSYLAFLGRRARRLVPAAAVCIALVTIAAVVVLMPDALSSFGRSLVAVWILAANFYFYGKSGYFDAPSADSPLLHTWSLAVEDQFYLTWPLLLLVLWRKLGTRPRIVAAILSLAALSLAYSEISVGTDPNFAFYTPLPRAFELLAGCALAIISGGTNPSVSWLSELWPSGRWIWALDAGGLGLILGSAFLISAGTPFPGLAVVPTVLGSALCILAGLSGPTPVSRLLAQRPVVLTGKMSYSIYLYHWPIFALASNWLGRAPDAWEAASLVGASLIAAALSWVFVEQKLTRRLGLITMAPGKIIATALAVSSVFCTVAVVMVKANGWPERLDGPAYEVYRAAASGNPRRPSCDGHELAFSNPQGCTFGRPLAENASYDIAVFGDSNADHFVPMVAVLAEQAGLTGRQVTESSCAPLIGEARDRAAFQEEQCLLYQQTILKFLDRNPGLKIAVLSAHWNDYTTVHANRIFEHNGDVNSPTFATFAQTTIDTFRRRGIKVLVIGQVPTFMPFSLRCFGNAARNGSEDRDCTIPTQDVDQFLGAPQAALQAIAGADTGVTFLSMRDIICTAERCSAFKDGVFLYRDGSHLNGSGSVRLAKYAKLPRLDP